MTAPRTMTRTEVLRHRVRAQQLDRARTRDWTTTRVLDLGVQDTGPDGASWALALRGASVRAEDDLRDGVLVWSVRGAPHLYRRADLPAVARALVPWSEADARRRLNDSARALVAAGVEAREALAEIGGHMRRIVDGPVVKGELSGRLREVLPETYLHDCKACRAVHPYEMHFRLAALHAGLEIAPRTSPPVLTPVPGWSPSHLAGLADAVLVPPGDRDVPARLDPVRAYLHLLGPARAKDVAEYLDAPAADVTAQLTSLQESGEVTAVEVDGGRRLALTTDLGRSTGDHDEAVRLLGPFDLFLQARDRPLVVPDPARRKELWPVLGRPGAVLSGAEVVGTWRPRASGGRLSVRVEPWTPWDDATGRAVDEQIERLAAFRGVEAAGRTTS